MPFKVKGTLFIFFTICFLLGHVTASLAMDSTELAISLNTDLKSSSPVPVGTVVIWSTTGFPGGSDSEYNRQDTDWLLCDGQYVPSQYSELRKLMSNTPNYQGMFLRGEGSQSFTQNNGTIIGRTTTSYASAKVGEIQGDAIRNVIGCLGSTFRPRYNSGSPTGPFYYGDWSGYKDSGRDREYHYTNSFDISRVVPTSVENRSVNVAVRYFIRTR